MTLLSMEWILMLQFLFIYLSQQIHLKVWEKRVMILSTFKFLSGQMSTIWVQFREVRAFQENILFKVIMEKCTFILTT